MNKPQQLLNRLTAIAGALSKRESALALIGLGSVGLELDRLDPYSDLDFFVIVKEGHKADYLQDLSWLTDIAPVAYHFLNTKDGYKLLYQDGIFCEFAIFEQPELAQIPFTAGRIVWKAAGVHDTIAMPQQTTGGDQDSPPTEWLLGEALTNLYVGLLRDHRGEKLSATRFIQGYAVDRILQLFDRLHPPAAGHADPFNLERRYEQRHPAIAPLLPELLQGYQKNRQSALAALTLLDNYFDLNPALKKAIQDLCTPEP